MAEKYVNFSSYAYVMNNPINAIDPDGRKIIFVNGYLGFGSPEGGSIYWGGANSSFVNGAKTFFNDNNIPFFTNYDHSIVSHPLWRRSKGYEYAKQNYEKLISDMNPEEDVFRFVTHSMGGTFADGMIEYLRERGWNVEAAIHLNVFEPTYIKKWDGTLLIDATTTNDWVQSLGISILRLITNNRDIPNSDYKIRKKSTKEKSYIHRDLIDSGDIWNTNSNNGITWNKAMGIIQSWLKQNPNIKINYE